MDLNNHGVLLTHISSLGLGTSIVFTSRSEAMVAPESERLAKGPYQRTTPPALGSGLTTLVVPAFTVCATKTGVGIRVDN